LFDGSTLTTMILQESFYQQDTISVARELLGKILVHKSREETTTGRIVETEAYRGPEDRAEHSSEGCRTARNEVILGKKGMRTFILSMGYITALM
jgi:DNA-3-methyladenine glycosylase